MPLPSIHEFPLDPAPELKTHAFDLMSQEPSLIHLIHRFDPTLTACKFPLDIATKLLPLICKITIFPFPLENQSYKLTEVDHNLVTAQTYYESVIRKYEAIRCGGANTFFTKTLNEYFGVPAFTINMGTLSTPHTHVITIIPVKKDSKHNFYLFDSHFGCYFTDFLGNWLDLESIFAGTPFILKTIRYEKRVIVDFLNEEIKKKLSIIRGHLIRKTQDTRLLYGFSPQENFYSYYSLTEKHQFHSCSWRETCVLQYLDFGELLGLANPSIEIFREFLSLIDKFHIKTYSSIVIP